MAESTSARLQGLPDNVERALSAFLTTARASLSDDLVSAVLFGSAAEGKLARTSDVNLMLVLRAFVPERINKIRDAYLAAEAAIRLRAMFVAEDELAAAAELFAQKFADILRRHRVVLGKDVLASLAIPRAAEIFRLRQVLMNLVLRLRESYIGRGHRSEQARAILADAFGPLRAACATLLELEGVPNPESIDALATVAASFGTESNSAAARLVLIHEGGSAGTTEEEAFAQVLALTVQIAQRASRLT